MKKLYLEKRKRKVALVFWNRLRITHPKDMGGLGFHGAYLVNKSFILKVAWELLIIIKTFGHKFCDPNITLWEISFRHRQGKCGALTCGRGKCSLADLRDCLGWSVGNGESINFWNDNWLLNGSKLIDCTRVQVQPCLLSDSLAQYCSVDTGWRWSQMEQFLLAVLLLHLSTISFALNSGDRDKLYWKVSSSGRFTIKSAYAFNYACLLGVILISNFSI